jgi:hypothetical protein
MSVPRPAPWAISLDRSAGGGWSHTLRFVNGGDDSLVDNSEIDLAMELWDLGRTTLLATATVNEIGSGEWTLSLSQGQISPLPDTCYGDVLMTASDGTRRYPIEVTATVSG